MCNINALTRDVSPDADPAVVVVNNPANATFKITDTKLYVPVVILSIEDDNKLLDQKKARFKRTIKWTKYRSVMLKQIKTNSLNYLIAVTFSKHDKLFVPPFENEHDQTSFSKYYTPSVEIKYFNVLIDAKSFF